MDDQRDYNSQRLQWSLQALSRPAAEQLTLYPDFVCPGDELVLEFDEHYQRVREEGNFTTLQSEALGTLDSFLEKHSGEAYSRMYLTAEGLDQPEWREIRSLAKAALDAFGWNDELPPSDRGDKWVG